ncbi:TVP38/TMEM64 family protein [Psychromonas marina]|uniref:TVP38/TMEM64 family protein n=1 Tax=Psychromonas marina TaxID=88364 RepID=A0ABQ6E424_9GAMM|nr:VTT domain-containing protein [Psychromonas marina]GLS92091.1 TVP38/TMEM64 family protein [Psychromonas marina]
MRILKIVIWITLVALAILGMRWLTSNYSVSELQDAIEAYYWYILSAYALLISIRGLLFIPTMPVIIMMASSIDYWVMFSVTLVATCCSAYLVCLAVDHLDMHKKIQALPSKTLKRAQEKINSSGMAAITGWAFFPLVFTDIIVYIARLSGMSYKQILLGIAIGEGLLIFIIIALTEWLIALLQ